MRELSQGEESPRGSAAPPLIPEPQPEPEPIGPQAAKSGWIAGALVAAALLLGAGYMSGLFGETTPPPQPQAAISAPATQGFSMLQPVAAADQGTALQGLVMADADKQSVAKAVQQGSLRLAWLAFSDSGAEDGDIIAVNGANFSQVVPLLKKQTRLAVPYAPGAPVKVFAKKDGSAPGITVAVYLGQNVFRLKTMKEGEAIEIATP